MKRFTHLALYAISAITLMTLTGCLDEIHTLETATVSESKANVPAKSELDVLKRRRDSVEDELQRYTLAVFRAVMDCEKGGEGYRSCNDEAYLRTEMQQRVTGFVSAQEAVRSQEVKELTATKAYITQEQAKIKAFKESPSNTCPTNGNPCD